MVTRTYEFENVTVRVYNSTKEEVEEIVLKIKRRKEKYREREISSSIQEGCTLLKEIKAEYVTEKYELSEDYFMKYGKKVL